jgi:hypothetical protein
MDIALVSENSLKIKNKKAILAIDPSSKVLKFDADAVLELNGSSDSSRVNQVGEYEVSGLKIAGIKAESDVIFKLVSDNANTLIAKASSLDKIAADKLEDYQIVIINVDEDLKQSLITAMEPKVVIFYGLKAEASANALGKENVVKTSKINLNEDKLPDEMSIYILA